MDAGGSVSSRRLGGAFKAGQELDIIGALDFKDTERRLLQGAATAVGIGPEFAALNKNVVGAQARVTGIQKTRVDAGRGLTGQAQADAQSLQTQLEERQRKLQEAFQETLANSTKFIDSLNTSSDKIAEASKAFENFPDKINLEFGEHRVVIDGSSSFENSIQRATEKGVMKALNNQPQPAADPTRNSTLNNTVRVTPTQN